MRTPLKEKFEERRFSNKQVENMEIFFVIFFTSMLDRAVLEDCLLCFAFAELCNWFKKSRTMCIVCSTFTRAWQ